MLRTVVLVLPFYLILKAHCRSLHGRTAQRLGTKVQMQRFAVVLFAFVALFAIFVPSSVNALSHVKRETNADRFARGLTPLPPSRRSTAKRQQTSQVSVPRSGRIQVRGHGSDQSIGYLQNAPSGPGGINPGNNPDLSVQYNPNDNSITCVDSQFNQGGSYLGGLTGSQNLNAGSPFYVPLTNGDNNNPNFEPCIWTVDKTGQLSAQWKNGDGSTVPASCAYNADQNTFVLTGDSGDFCSNNSGWEPVDLYVVD